MTLAESKMCTFTLDSTHFIFNKCPIYTHDGASDKFRTNSLETDYSVSFLKLQKEQRITSNRTASRLRVPNLKESLEKVLEMP